LRPLANRPTNPSHAAPPAFKGGNELTVSDQGIDMEIELTDDRQEAAGRKLYLQRKSGDPYLRERKRDGAEIFTIKDERHACYWMDQAFSVLLVGRNSEWETGVSLVIRRPRLRSP
jgi:hypothetical protein